MHATKRIAAITPHRALVVLRFLLNTNHQNILLFPVSLKYLQINYLNPFSKNR